ncbi:peptidylprolyl isomerase [Candidatus Sumerlaeota bacterium]|nr:peptidylprolyl isomerase [Candidatus Sumerlaeota bacterium]
MKMLCVLSTLILLMLAPWCAFGQQDATDIANDATKGDPALMLKACIQTSLGDLTYQLDGNVTPIAVLNFLQYAESGFYQGTVIHKIKPGIMIQGGSYLPDGTIKQDGLREDEPNDRAHGQAQLRGTLAMMHQPGKPDTIRSEFFINLADNIQLEKPVDNAPYPVIGRLIGGEDVLQRIAEVKTMEHPGASTGRELWPVEPIIIKDVEIIGDYDKARLEELAASKREWANMLAPLDEMKGAEQAERYAQWYAQQSGLQPVALESGVQYFVLKPGDDGRGLEPTDKVKVHYRGFYADDEEFDNSYTRGEPATFTISQLVKGWAEGTKGMTTGEKRLLIIPSYLGYGSSPPPGIRPDALLLFEVELIEIL